MSTYVFVKVEIQQSTGSWLDVSDGVNYKVAKDSLTSSAVTFRRDEVTNAFVEGKFLVNALRDNVVENLVIYVYGDTMSSLKTKIDALTSAVSQVNFNARITMGSMQKLWECWSSDYTVGITTEFLHNTQAMVTVQLHRLPSEIVSAV
jgi:hypothetical protein